MGKPVVSISLPEVNRFNFRYSNIVLIATDKEEFSACIKKALADNNSFLMQRRIETARMNSWESRVSQMSMLMEECIRQKEMCREQKWQDLLLSFYRRARIRILRFLTIVGILCISIFYTPLVWWLAEPLKMSQVPKAADAIVVLAGGVGESGRPAQGYEERVQHAVELYKKGYADYLIFSSGYMYVFKEPLVMKALAMSLGVPEKAIILEDKAINTYQNVKFVKAILTKKNWDKIILVSSPYHMRRTSLVFNKIASYIKVIYSPIPESKFYKRALLNARGKKILRKINLKQIKGIVHEYLGILYYWCKGYI
jgi:uncharacterized SAM-binding protein YcdF (DUF218 family)